MGADVCNPVVDDCQEAVEAISGQLTDRDFRSQARQLRLPVQPRDAEGGGLSPEAGADDKEVLPCDH